MNSKRLIAGICLCLIPSGTKRAAYIRKHNLFHSFGKNGLYMPRKLPLYSELISVGDNCCFASNVGFLTHDCIHRMVNRSGLAGDKKLKEKIGCIEIGNNVFIGSGTVIMYDTKIGNNVVIGTHSVVTKDIPDNSVAVGSPARVVSSIDKLIDKRTAEATYPDELKPVKQQVSKALAQWCWDDFNKRKK